MMPTLEGGQMQSSRRRISPPLLLLLPLPSILLFGQDKKVPINPASNTVRQREDQSQSHKREKCQTRGWQPEIWPIVRTHLDKKTSERRRKSSQLVTRTSNGKRFFPVALPSTSRPSSLFVPDLPSAIFSFIFHQSLGHRRRPSNKKEPMNQLNVHQKSRQISSILSFSTKCGGGNSQHTGAHTTCRLRVIDQLWARSTCPSAEPIQINVAGRNHFQPRKYKFAWVKVSPFHPAARPIQIH